VLPSAAALAVPVERDQERGQSGGTGSDLFSIFRCCMRSKATESAADLVVSFQSATLWSKQQPVGGVGRGGQNLGPVASTWPQAFVHKPL
jgi:hypothetical protein